MGGRMALVPGGVLRTYWPCWHHAALSWPGHWQPLESAECPWQQELPPTRHISCWLVQGVRLLFQPGPQDAKPCQQEAEHAEVEAQHQLPQHKSQVAWIRSCRQLCCEMDRPCPVLPQRPLQVLAHFR